MKDNERMYEQVLIAKYMGLSPMKGYNGHTNSVYYYYNNHEMQDYEALPNYKDWEWLMGVIEKINQRDSVIITKASCEIISTIEAEFTTIENNNKGLLDFVYDSVLGYVKWATYNNK